VVPAAQEGTTRGCVLARGHPVFRRPGRLVGDGGAQCVLLDLAKMDAKVKGLE
jgi:hypothetical protein